MSAAGGESAWPSLGIVVPVYNEAATIERVVQAIGGAAKSYPGRAVLIAVDDGSDDGSGAKLAELAREVGSLELAGHDENAGYGEAQRTGAACAHRLGLDYVAFMDSDLTNPPADLLKIGRLARDGHPYIKGSRLIPGGGMAAVPPLRRLLTRVANFVARHLFGTRIRDVTNGFRAARTDLFLSWNLHERGFAVIVEEFDAALRSGIVPMEFATVLGSRSGEQRASAFAACSPRLLASYLRYPLRARWRRLTGHKASPA